MHRDLHFSIFDWSYAGRTTEFRDGSGVVGDALDGALIVWACPCRERDLMQAPLANAAFSYRSRIDRASCSGRGGEAVEGSTDIYAMASLCRTPV